MYLIQPSIYFSIYLSIYISAVYLLDELQIADSVYKEIGHEDCRLQQQDKIADCNNFNKNSLKNV